MISNEHVPTEETRQRVADLATAGIFQYLIAQVIDIDEETLKKHYRKELDLSEPLMVERIARKVMIQALEGNEKSQSLYLKTKGAKFGYIEKQVVENVSNDETKELKDKIIALEEKYKKDY